MFKLTRRGQTAEFRESDRRVCEDAYIGWLCKIVGGWLEADHGNLRAFDHAIRQMPPQGAAIEVGSFLGASTNALAYLLVKYQRDNPFFSCDPWTFEGVEEPIGGYFDAANPAFPRYAREVFCLNLNLFSPSRKPYAMALSSSEFFERWDRHATLTDVFGRSITLGGPISFAYIDGAHTYDAVHADFLAIDQHLVPGGFILLDDSDDGGCFAEVTRAVQDCLASRAYDVVFTTPHYFARKRP